MGWLDAGVRRLAARPSLRRLRSFLRPGEAGRLELLLERHPVTEVRARLEKAAAKGAVRAVDDLAAFWLRCAEVDRARALLEAAGREDGLVYLKAQLATGASVADLVEGRLARGGKLPKAAVQLLAKWVVAPADRLMLHEAVLRGKPLEQERALWRLRALGEAARRAGEYPYALSAYRRAFRCALEGDPAGLERAQRRAAGNQSGFAAEKVWRAFDDFRAIASPGWFLDAGTLLGFVREGAFLTHDYDVDLGLIDPVAFADTKEKLARSPLFDVKPGRVSEVVKVRHVSGIDIDLFLYRCSHGVMFKQSHVYRWDFKPFRVELRAFGDLELPVPEHAEAHLATVYGDWWVPQPGFDGRYDALNASFPNIDELECVLLNKAILALQRRDGAAARKELAVLARVGRPAT